MSSPLVSVIMPVFNGFTLIKEGLESLSSQTLEDIEIIVVDDGSTDSTIDAVREHKDPRVQLLHQANGGVSSARNLGINSSRGIYVAFQDHDDVSQASRLQIQFDYLKRHPDVGLLGSRSTIISNDGQVRGGHNHPLSDAELRFEMMFDNPFVTSSIMTRKKVIEDIGAFTLDRDRHPEDFELWSRISRRYKLANLPDRLVIYRETAGSLSSTHVPKKIALLAAENMASSLGIKQPDRDTLDLAFWYHASYQELSPRPNFGRMFKILENARDRITTDCAERDIINKSIARHLEALITSRSAKYLPTSLRIKRRFLRLRKNMARIFQ